jgi:hypothetical protein
MFGGSKIYFRGDKPVEDGWQEGKKTEGKKSDELLGLTPEYMAERVNVFMASRRIVIGSEFVEQVLKKAGLSKKEKKDMISATNGEMLDNNLSDSANLAYLDRLRKNIEDVIGVGPGKLDVSKNL